MVMDYSGWQRQNTDPGINPKTISIKEYSKVTVPTLIMQGELSGEFCSYTLGKLNQYSNGVPEAMNVYGSISVIKNFAKKSCVKIVCIYKKKELTIIFVSS